LVVTGEAIRRQRQAPQHKAIRHEFYRASLPAASWVQVQRLYLPSYVLEVELTAEFEE
jgi:enamine deaminase RidA (YjgF/YER057c/UK114 family)